MYAWAKCLLVLLPSLLLCTSGCATSRNVKGDTQSLKPESAFPPMDQGGPKPDLYNLIGKRVTIVGEAGTEKEHLHLVVGEVGKIPIVVELPELRDWPAGMKPLAQVEVIGVLHYERGEYIPEDTSLQGAHPLWEPGKFTAASYYLTEACVRVLPE